MMVVMSKVAGEQSAGGAVVPRDREQSKREAILACHIAYDCYNNNNSYCYKKAIQYI
jgi:hypothetical protein